MKYLLLIALIFALHTKAQAQVSKYKPGFQFWMEGARTQATLIEQFREIDKPGIKEILAKAPLKTKSDSLNLKLQIKFFSVWMWKVKLEESYGGSIGTVSATGQITEEVIDLATGKAFRYKHKVIYYDSAEDCLSDKNPN